MATSRLTVEDAQEWLESLQQVGEGWWRQVGLAVRANAHKTLGMERRDFVRKIGQRLIDPREAIIELYREGHSQKQIADILGVAHDKTVRRILMEEGLVKEITREASDSTDDTAREASAPKQPSEKLQKAQAEKDAAKAATSGADQKAAEAEFEEFVKEFRKGVGQAAGVFLVPFAQELRKEMARVMDADLDIPDYEEVIRLWAEVGNELWVYGAKRGFDVSRIAEIIDKAGERQ